MDKILCRVVELPARVNAVTVVDEDGDYNVYVNAMLPKEARRRAYEHECRHIKKHHFYRTETAGHCELEVKED